jgi:hypothetical protein
MISIMKARYLIHSHFITKHVPHIRNKKLALLALLFAALPSSSYAYEKCSDMPGYRLAVDDRDDKLRQIGQVKSKIWVLDIPKKG